MFFQSDIPQPALLHKRSLSPQVRTPLKLRYSNQPTPNSVGVAKSTIQSFSSHIQDAFPQGIGHLFVTSCRTCSQETCSRQVSTVPYQSSVFYTTKTRRQDIWTIDVGAARLFSCSAFDCTREQIWMPAVPRIPTRMGYLVTKLDEGRQEGRFETDLWDIGLQ